MEEKKPAGRRADRVVVAAGIRNRVIAGRIISAIDFHDAFQYETLLGFPVIVFRKDTAGRHPHEARALSSRRIDVQHLQPDPRYDIEPNAVRFPA
jgi:hypothetical protein